MMKKAEKLIELVRNLNPDYRPTTKDREIYVSIYEDIIKRLSNRLLAMDIPNQTILVTGQSGTGKSTALEFLKTDKTLTDKFYILTVGLKDIVDLADINIIDILLGIGYAIGSECAPLKEKYFKKLDELQKLHSGSLYIEKDSAICEKKTTGVEGNLSIGANWLNFLGAGVKIFSSYQSDSDCRYTARQIFGAKKSDLKKLIDGMIADFYAEKNLGAKELLLIIDDVEKMQIPENIEKLFCNDYSFLFGLNCKKIIPIPIPASTYPILTNAYSPIERFILQLKDNPLEKHDGLADKIKKNRDSLREIIHKRANKELVADDAIDEAILMSGGILRQFIFILQAAALKSFGNQGTSVSKSDVEAAWREHKSSYEASVVSSDLIEMLNKVRTKHRPDVESDLFISALQSNQVVAYANGTLWYEVNPLIEQTVELYAKHHK
ncbi:MAG: hypothetical protein ACYC4Q_04385 [Victivallaceae bacterium]